MLLPRRGAFWWNGPLHNSAFLPEQLATENGSVFAAAVPGRRVAYKDLMGDGYFETSLEWNGQMGNDLLSKGRAQPKAPADYKVVGTSIPRIDIRNNVFARQTYVTDMRLPGMLHARMIRPQVVGTEPTRSTRVR